MPVREFLDARGERWLAWDTQPSTQARLQPQFASGWLTFESGRRRRRLAPVPDGWHDLSEDELRELCTRATAVRRVRKEDEGAPGHEPTPSGHGRSRA